MGNYPFFPMFVDISEKQVLVVGAGTIAARRVGTLKRFTPHIRIVAPQIHPDIESMKDAQILRRGFVPQDIDGADIVLAATDDPELNGQIALLCREKGIPVNVSSDRTLCDFYFPGVAGSDDLVVGVTAGGNDHALAKRVTAQIRELLSKK